MKDKARKEIESLQNKINPLQKKIYEIQEEETNKIQLPRCRAMIGWYLKSTYDDGYWAKIIDFIEPKNGYNSFILEKISLGKDGIPILCLEDCMPYLNKEWWDIEVPMSGWERTTEAEYNRAKNKILKELDTGNLIKSRVAKYK